MEVILGFLESASIDEESPVKPMKRNQVTDKLMNELYNFIYKPQCINDLCPLSIR